MRKLLYLLLLSIPLFGNAQLPYLNNDLEKLEKIYVEQKLNISFANDGTKVASVSNEFGNYNYYFDSTTEITDYCIQFLPNNRLLNHQVEFYNKNFVVISDKEWKAYLDSGIIMNIKLVNDQKSGLTSFHYKTF